MIHTRICDLLGITHPIVLGGMGSATNAPFGAAVSNAGGFGTLGTSAFNAATLKAEVGACFDVLRTASQNLDWDKADAPDAELRAQIMSWSLVHGFAQLALAGKLDKDATRSLGILDVVPDFGFRDQASDGEP